MEGRIEKYKGIRFYEKDIIVDNHIYTKDIEITADVLFASAGFGIVLMNSVGDSIKEKEDVFLFKVGYKEISAYYATKLNRVVLSQHNCLQAYTIQEHLQFKLIKKGKRIIVKINDDTVLDEYLHKNLDKYNVGYYSNAGNIINSVDVKSNIPNSWNVNMKETNGGHISFYDDGFELEGCQNKAEIEQSNIYLEKGVYYFKCETSAIDGKNDLNYYILPNEENLKTNYVDRFYNDKKSILNKTTGVFVLKEDCFVHLKFVGTQGQVKNIKISENSEDAYIGTGDVPVEFEGSHIDVILTDIKKIEWTGIIRRTPHDVGEGSSQIYGLILDNKTQIRPLDLGMSYGIEYDFSFNTDNYNFEVRRDGKLIHEDGEYILKNLVNKVTIFKNMTSEISSLKLFKKNGNVIDVNIQDQNHESVPGDINSPILVVDKYETPLDISSSYRLCTYENHERYVFTNWEREIFNPEKAIHLENKIINQQDSVIVYGLLKGFNHNYDNILRVNEDIINDITPLSKNYEVINNIEFIDKTSSIIYLNEFDIDKYETIIVDYLKRDSYCINYNYNSNSYLVNISSTNKDNKLIYNSNVSDESFAQINTHLITNIDGDINSYIVIRKEG